MSSFSHQHKRQSVHPSASNQPISTDHPNPDLNYPASSPDEVIRLQALIGNQAVQRLLKPSQIQRETPDTPANTGGTIHDWMQVLNRVKRTKEQRITKVKDKTELNMPDVDTPAMSPQQQNIVQQIQQNRQALPPALEKLKLSPYKKDKEAGYFYRGSYALKGEDPANTSEKRKKVMEAIRTEIGGEGGWSAVNTYDDAIVTLGRGFTRTLLAKVMQTFFANDAEAKNAFLDVGVTWQGNTAWVVNTATGAIEEGDNALRLIQLEPAILSIFVKLAESEEHGKKLLQAQEAQTLSYQIPQTVIDNWNDMMAIRLVAHLIHWRSGKLWAAYASCNDDVHAIMQVAKPIINKDKTDDKKGGAHIITSEQRGVLFAFAEGKAKEALDVPDAVELPESVEKDSMKGKMLLDSGDGKKFYRMSPVRMGTTVLIGSFPPIPENELQ